MDFWARRMFEFDMGRYFVATFQFALTIAIFVKLYFSRSFFAIVLIVVGFMLVWLFGLVLVRSGFLLKYQKSNPILVELLTEIKKINRKLKRRL